MAATENLNNQPTVFKLGLQLWVGTLKQMWKTAKRLDLFFIKKHN